MSYALSIHYQDTINKSSTLSMWYEQKGKHEISILVFQNKIHLPFYCDRMSEVFFSNYQAYRTSVYSFSYIFQSRNLTHTNYYHPKHFSMCKKILACIFDFNNSISPLLGQSPKMLIESLSQTHETGLMLAFSISIARRGLGSHSSN